MSEDVMRYQCTVCSLEVNKDVSVVDGVEDDGSNQGRFRTTGVNRLPCIVRYYREEMMIREV